MIVFPDVKEARAAAAKSAGRRERDGRQSQGAGSAENEGTQMTGGRERGERPKPR